MADMQVVLDIIGKNNASGPLGAVESAIGKLSTVAIAGTAAMVAGLGYAANAAAGFEQTMSGVKAVSGATADQMQQLSGLALQLGKDTVFSASAAGQGLEELVKGGVSIEDIMGGAAKATLNLASAGGVDLKTAAELASNAINSFNLSGADMAHVSDMIAGAANASAIDVGQFGQAMSQSSAVAATVGISFDDLSVAIAEMGNAGIKGSDAGTSLKTMLLNLSPSTKQAATEMRELGIITADGSNKFFDAQGHAKDLADISDVLQTATKNLTDQQKLQALQTLFGTDAIRAASVMAKGGAEGFDTLAASMSKVTAESVAADRLDNLKGDLEQLKGSVETAAISLGERLQPALRTATQGATGFVNGLIPLVDQYGPGVVSALESAATGAATFGNQVKDHAIDALQSFREKVDDAGLALAPWAATASEKGKLVSDALSGVNGVATALQELLQGDFSGAAATAAGALDNFKGAAEHASAALRDDLQPALDGVRGALQTTSAEAANRGVWDDFSGSLGSLQKAGKDLSDVWDGLVGAFGGARPTVQGTGKDINIAAETVKAFSGNVKNMADGAASLAAGISSIGGAFSAIGTAADNAGGAVQRLKNVIASGGFTLPNIAAAAAQAGSDAGAGLRQGMLSQTGGVQDAGAQLGNAATSGTTTALDAHSPSRVFMALGSNIGDGLADGIKSKDSAVRQAARDLAHAAAVATQEARPVGDFELLGSDMGGGLELGLLRSIPKAKTAAETMGDSILNELRSFTSNVDKQIQSVTDKLADSATKASDAVAEALDKEGDAIQSAWENATDSISRLNSSFDLSSQVSARKAALNDMLSDESRAHAQSVAAAEAEYQYKLQLSQAERKENADLAKAKTDKEREEIKARYGDTVADTNQRYADSKVASDHQNAIAEAERIFREGQAKKQKDLDDQLSRDSLARQIADMVTSRDKSIETSQQTYKDAVSKAQLTADTSRQILLRSYTERIDDLKAQLLDKLPPLTDQAQSVVDDFLSNVDKVVSSTTQQIIDQTGAAVTSVGALTSAIQNIPTEKTVSINFVSTGNGSLTTSNGSGLNQPVGSTQYGAGYNPSTGTFSGGGGGSSSSSSSASGVDIARAQTDQSYRADLRSQGYSVGSDDGSSAVYVEKRAAGGPVSAGHLYQVNENNTEFFVPSTGGYITPNGAGGGDTHLHLTIQGSVIGPGMTKTQFINWLQSEFIQLARRNGGPERLFGR